VESVEHNQRNQKPLMKLLRKIVDVKQLVTSLNKKRYNSRLKQMMTMMMNNLAKEMHN
jgi:hypothetical protein